MGTREAMRAAAQTVAETAVEGAAGMGPGSAGEAAALQDGPRAADGAAASAMWGCFCCWAWPPRAWDG